MSSIHTRTMVPNVTVVIPAFRAEATVRRAVESALNQNKGNVAVIVVVDDLCDRTRQAVETIADDRITVVWNNRNMGAPASRNRGLQRTTTPYVSFLDADDHYEGNFLEPLVREMAKLDADIGFGPSVTWSPRRGFQRRRVPRYRNHEHIFTEWMGRRNNVNTASVVWSTCYVRSIGGWDTKLRRNQDGEIALRAILSGARYATSSEGAGVWTNDCSLSRITTRTDNLESLLTVVDKFLAMRSEAVSDEQRVRVCARYCLTIAHLAFSSDQDDIGRRALARRRALGFPDYQGDIRYISSVTLRLLPRAPRLRFWRTFRKLRAMVSWA